MNNGNEHDSYVIPPNFVETGTIFGGMFKARNAIEAGVLAVVVGIPVFVFLPLGLTARIIVLCLTALPLALVALIGISGESLSSFLFIFLKYMRNRRVVGGNDEGTGRRRESAGKGRSKNTGKKQKKSVGKQEAKAERAPEKRQKKKQKKCFGDTDFPAEFDEIRGYEVRQKLRPAKKAVKKKAPEREKRQREIKPWKMRQTEKRQSEKEQPKKKRQKQKSAPAPKPARAPEPSCLNPVADYLPVLKVENGIIYTKDHRYVKVVEIVPINFLLRSAREQRSIIYSFVSYLKISPVKLQFKVLTRRADINRHMDTVRKEIAQETNEQCRLMQEDYLQFVQQIGSREAVTRRFFLIFEYEPWNNTKHSEEEGEAIGALQSAVHTAANYLRQCGNEVIVPENEDEFTVDVLYNLLCRNESAVKPLPLKVKEVVAQYMEHGREQDIDHIPAADFFAPSQVDFTHSRHINIDGLYYAYLLIPSDGFKVQVMAGWLSLIVNAGDGIDLDMFLIRQPKERVIQSCGSTAPA